MMTRTNILGAAFFLGIMALFGLAAYSFVNSADLPTDLATSASATSTPDCINNVSLCPLSHLGPSAPTSTTAPNPSASMTLRKTTTTHPAQLMTANSTPAAGSSNTNTLEPAPTSPPIGGTQGTTTPASSTPPTSSSTSPQTRVALVPASLGAELFPQPKSHK